HEGRLLEIVARVSPDRMDVAPGPLDRIVEEDAAAAAGLEQSIDGAHASIRCLGGIPPVARPLGAGNLRPVSNQTHLFGGVTEHGPVAEVAPARERPPATEAKASIDPLYRSRGRQGRRKLDARVLAPDVVLRLRREEAEVPVVNADDAEDPGARAADGADLHD